MRKLFKRSTILQVHATVSFMLSALSAHTVVRAGASGSSVYLGDRHTDVYCHKRATPLPGCSLSLLWSHRQARHLLSMASQVYLLYWACTPSRSPFDTLQRACEHSYTVLSYEHS